MAVTTIINQIPLNSKFISNSIKNYYFFSIKFQIFFSNAHTIRLPIITNPTMCDDNAIQLIIKIRSKKNDIIDDMENIELYGDSTLKIVSKNETYSFNAICDATTTQEEFFTQFILPKYETHLPNGYTLLFLTYGQTGSGKTFTVEGDWINNSGILPRSIEYCFEKYKIQSVQYFEIYLNKYYNLLDNYKECKSYNDVKFTKIENNDYTYNSFLEYIHKASLSRKFSETKKNKSSSRGHTVLILKLNNGSNILILDLAGSERCKTAGTQDDPQLLKEGININQSLQDLSKLIRQLTKSLEKSKIIRPNYELGKFLFPYIVTRAITTFIICLSADKIDNSESYNSIKFGQNLKTIKLKISDLKRPKSALIYLKNKENRDKVIDTIKTEHDLEIETLKNEKEKIEQELEELKLYLENNKHTIDSHSDNNMITDNDAKNLIFKVEDLKIPIEINNDNDEDKVGKAIDKITLMSEEAKRIHATERLKYLNLLTFLREESERQT